MVFFQYLRKALNLPRFKGRIGAMADPTLYRLHLRRPLSYSVDSSADTDTLMLFSDETLVLRNPEAGPAVANPLPSPLFSGGIWLAPLQDRRAEADCRAAPKTAGPAVPEAPASTAAGTLSTAAAPDHYVLAARDYIFSQWRQSDFATLEEGLENFVRQVWWEQRKCEGPWILRRIREDGGVAFQGLRAVSDSD